MKAMLMMCCLLPACAVRAQAQALALPPPPVARFAPQAGTPLPMDALFTDEDGKPVRLGALFAGTPVVLVPGYYTCPNLCSTLFEGVLQALVLSGLPAGGYRLVGVSIDPRDTPRQAAAKRRGYEGLLPGAGGNLHLLTGRPKAISALTSAIGYRAAFDPALGQYAHAAGFVVATPDGRVSRYFGGVRFEPAALRDAVLAARADQVGGIGRQLLLLCAHYDPALGRHSAAAMGAVRGAAMLVPLALFGWAWRRRSHRRRR